MPKLIKIYLFTLPPYGAPNVIVTPAATAAAIIYCLIIVYYSCKWFRNESLPHLIF